MSAAKYMLEKAKEYFNHPAVLEDQCDNIRFKIKSICCDQKRFALLRSASSGFVSLDMRRTFDGDKANRYRQLFFRFGGNAESDFFIKNDYNR